MKVKTSKTTETAGGQWLKEPGTYHMIISSGKERSINKDGQPMDACSLTMKVCAGTVEGQEDKQTELRFFDPKETSKDGGEFARTKLTRMLIAISMIKHNELDGDVDIEFNEQTLTGRQCFVTLEKNEDGYMDLHYADIFHVDDPEAKKFPRNQQIINMMKKDWRLSGDAFKKDGSDGKETTKAPAVPAGGVSLDDL